VSTSMYRTKVSKLQADIASLRKKLGQEKAIEAKKTSDLTNVQRSITKRTSSSSLRMKENKINRLLAEVAKTQKRIADLEKRIASKTKELHSYETRLSKAEAKEGKSRRAEELRHERALTREVEKRRQIEAVRDRISAEFPNYDDFVDEGGQDAYSVFISHASEDKEAFVAPLAQLLSQMGFRVWYDDFVLTVGDSLRQSIDKGIANSAYGLIVLSPHFFTKGWTQHELDGLTAREIAGQKRLILPIWHGVGYEDVLRYSPTLADKVALNTEKMDLEEIAESLAEILPGRLVDEENDLDIEEPTSETGLPNSIGFRGPEHDKRAWVVGTGLDVWEIIQDYQAIGRERFLEESEISKEALDLALDYYVAHLEEVDRAIAENQRPPEEWGKLYPHVKPTCSSA
jgi:hypothetical protein